MLLHHPYESFTASVERFIQAAVDDPDVVAIKLTLYRTGGDSSIVRLLAQAAERGKQVAVLIELKARFDEENNIRWAQRLEDVGVHVSYGVAGLKTHAKVMLVVRREGEAMRRYLHLGTGNYHPGNARLYTDFGLLTSDPDLGADLTDLFNVLTGFGAPAQYRKLIVAPRGMRERFIAMIRREAERARTGGPARVLAKMNALVDPAIIQALYEASQDGAQIDLIVRGICCLRPGIPGVSERIRVISILGRFLEHSRAFYFLNGGEEEVYIGSADWMPRNLDRRIEAVVPVEDPAHRMAIRDLLNLMWQDNRQAWELEADGRYTQRRPTGNDAELATHRMLMETHRETARATGEFPIPRSAAPGVGGAVPQACRFHVLLEQRLLLGRQLLRDFHLHLDQLVATPVPLGDAEPLDPELAARLGARRNPQHHLLAVEGAHPQTGAEDRLGQVERNLADDVQTLPAEEAVGLNLKADQQIPGGLSRPASLPLTAEPDLGPGLGAGRHRDQDLVLDPHLACTAAGRAWYRRDAALAPAPGTGPTDREPALAERHRAPAVALAAGGHRGPGRRPASPAGRTALVHGEVDRDLATEGGHPEGDLHDRLHRLRRSALAPALPEDRREDVSQSEAADVGEIESLLESPGRAAGPTGARATSHPAAIKRAQPAHLVVLLPLVAVGEHRVGLRDLLEAFGGL